MALYATTFYFFNGHLGYTRMVINDEHTVTEAVMYYPYGTMVPVENYSSAIPAREKFTGKEFDHEGSGVGISGMDLYYFGKVTMTLRWEFG